MYARDARVAGSIPAWTTFHPLIADETYLLRRMPVQPPFNPDALWKGKIQQARYPEPMRGPDFWLPKFNTLTGHLDNPPNLTKENCAAYAAYSARYWAGVKQRRAAYREAKLWGSA